MPTQGPHQQMHENFRVVAGGKDGPLIFQLFAQFSGIDQIAVVGQGDVPALVMGQEGLGVATGGAARGGIAHVAHRSAAGERAQAGFRKNVGHQTHALVLMHAVRVLGDDARAFLAPVLLSVQAEIRQTGRVIMLINAEKATFMPNHILISPASSVYCANAQCDCP